MRTVIEQAGGVKSVVQLNHDGSLTTGTIQDCTAILDNAKAKHNEGLHGSADLKLAASIPFVVVEQYCNTNNITFQEFMNSQDHKKRLLNDPNLSGFRVWGGRV
jgi:hypothetical protein